MVLLVIEEPHQLVGKELVEGKALQGIDRNSFEAFLKESKKSPQSRGADDLGV